MFNKQNVRGVLLQTKQKKNKQVINCQMFVTMKRAKQRNSGQIKQ